MAQSPDIQPFDVTSAPVRMGQAIQKTLGEDIPNIINKGFDTYTSLRADTRAQKGEVRDQTVFDTNMQKIADNKADLDTYKRAGIESLKRVASATKMSAEELVEATEVINNSTDPQRVRDIVVNFTNLSNHVTKLRAKKLPPITIEIGNVIGQPVEMFSKSLETQFDGYNKAALRGKASTTLTAFQTEKRLTTLKDTKSQDYMGWLFEKSARDPEAQEMIEFAASPDGVTLMQQAFGDGKREDAMALERLRGQNDLATAQAKLTASSTEKKPVLNIEDFLTQELDAVKLLKPAQWQKSPQYQTGIAEHNMSRVALYGLQAKFNVSDLDAIDILLRARGARETGDLGIISWDEMVALEKIHNGLYKAIAAKAKQRLKDAGKDEKIKMEYFAPPTDYRGQSSTEVTRRATAWIAGVQPPPAGAPVAPDLNEWLTGRLGPTATPQGEKMKLRTEE